MSTIPSSKILRSFPAHTVAQAMRFKSAQTVAIFQSVVLLRSRLQIYVQPLFYEVFNVYALQIFDIEIK